jgi:3'-phosphoadenosine 5'-phosphosulfate (PAPS) 3'-phosphatase
MKPTHGKIFGIGLSKTGTSSLAQALQMLGYKTLDNMGAARYVAGDLSSIDIASVEAHDALTDTPIPSFYRELDARYPGSKFILTVRDRQGWLKSCMKQFSPRFAEAQSEPNRRLFEDLYGTNQFDEAKFSAGYDRFVAGVLDYFKSRPGDLLVMNVTAGEGWEKLCSFLGQAVPEAPFPKANVTQIRWMKMEDLVAVAEEAGRALLQRYEGELAPATQPLRGASATGRKLLDRAMRVALGRDSTDAAVKSAHKVLVAGLRKLNPDIPVISPAEEPLPYAERKHLNHVWLVDPLDGQDAFADGGNDFSVNVALVEDGRALYGVVHAPAKGVTYFGRSGKGAFRNSLGAGPVRLSSPENSSPPPTSNANEPTGGSIGLSICAILENKPPHSVKIAPSMVWRIAAAHAVVGAAGLNVRRATTGTDFVYNSRQLDTAAAIVCA